MGDKSSNSNGNTPSVFKLKIKNIPFDLEKDALESMFSEYGEVTGIQLIKLEKRGENLAYLSYANYNEAERAIKALNNEKPLQLSVEFEDKDLKNYQAAPKFDLSRPIQDFRYKESCLDHLQTGKKLIEIGPANCTPSFQPNTFSHNDELLYECPTDLTTFNPYESAGPYRNTNLMYTRGTVHMNGRDGTRHVAYGRGYTYYRLPEPNPYVGAFIQNVLEKREKGLYEFAPENEEENSGNCKICSTPTLFRCQQCEITYYCSRNCQIEDWPKHKSECQSVPPLVRKVTTGKPPIQNVEIPAKISHENVNSTPKEKSITKPAAGIQKDESPMSASHKTVDHVQQEKSSTQPPVQNNNIPVKKNAANVQKKHDVGKVDEKEDKNSKMSIENTLSKQLDKKLIISNIFSVSSILEKLVVGSKGFVIFHALVGQGKFNVTLVPEDEVENFSKLVENLKEDCLAEFSKEPNYRPKIGEFICGETMEKEWYRGVVLSLNPVIKLAAIDEARIFVPIKIVPMPKNYNDIRRFGLTCEFSKNVKLPEKKAENMTGPYEVIKVSATKDAATLQISVEEPQIAGEAIVTEWNFKPEQMGVKYATLVSGQDVIITDFSSQNLIYVQSQEKEELERVSLLEQNIAKYALRRKPLSESPVIGQIVLAQFELDKNFYRAVVNKIEGSKVIIVYVDYGNEETTTVDNLYELPDELKEPASGVAKVTLKDVPADVPLNQEATLYFTELTGNKMVLKCTFTGHPLEEGVILTTSNKENVNKSIAHLLKPSWEKKEPAEEKKVYGLDDLPTLELGKAGEEVKAILLQYYENNGSMIFGPNDLEAVEAIQVQMQESIEKYVATNTDLYIPRDDELCIAKFSGSFYRAVCLEHSCAPDESRVYFIDYGNTERVKHNDIRMITEDFVNIGAYGILCNINSMVPQSKFTDKIATRIAELANINEIYTIKIVNIDENDLEPSIIIPEIHSKLVEEKFL